MLTDTGGRCVKQFHKNPWALNRDYTIIEDIYYYWRYILAVFLLDWM